MEELRGIQWRCPDESHPGTQFLHARLWEFDDPERRGAKAPLSVVVDDPPVDVLDARYPLRMTTGRRLDSFNTGAQTGGDTPPPPPAATPPHSPPGAARGGLGAGGRGRGAPRPAAGEAPGPPGRGARAG